MKMSEDEIRAMAIKGITHIESLLQAEAVRAEKQLWLIMDKEDIKVINYRPEREHVICKISRSDMQHGFSGSKWNNILLSAMEFLRALPEKG
jgi:hypothetical protein